MTTSELDKVASAERALAKHKRNFRLRIDAGLAYMTHPQGLTLDELAQDPRFARVSKRTLERWSSKDKWVERRQEFVAVWTARAKEKLGTNFMQRRLQELEELEEVGVRLLEALRNDETKPRTLEGVAKVFLDIGRRRDEIVTNVGNELVPGDGERRQVAAPPVPALPPGEAAQLAKELLRIRRSALRAEIGLDPDAVVVDVMPDTKPEPARDEKSGGEGGVGAPEDDADAEDVTAD
jgi:hypothetical protein